MGYCQLPVHAAASLKINQCQLFCWLISQSQQRNWDWSLDDLTSMSDGLWEKRDSRCLNFQAVKRTGLKFDHRLMFYGQSVRKNMSRGL
jgi:hypothetical protein